jgi:hypothetical protein
LTVAAWREVELASPDLTGRVRARFEAHGLALLATIRPDGGPRINGIEPLFADGELWLGMMPDSLKGRDLHRDARFALHSATVDKEVTDGDARISGTAVAVTDEAGTDRFRGAFEAATGTALPPGPLELFRADVSDLVLLWPNVDHLVIESWREGRGERRIERR